MAYQHGVRVLEQETSLSSPIEGTAGLQVVFGTAPINQADDPYAVTNVPVIAYTYKEAVSQLGFSYDFANYTLCQSIYASFMLHGVAPVIFINVLDPTKHIVTNDTATAEVVNLQATVEVTGILPDTVTVKSGSTTLALDTDYTLSFDDDGYLVITLLSSGAGASATSLTVDSTSIDPTAVEADDIIGGVDSTTGAETGMELVRAVYPKFGMTPGLLLAPGWSHLTDVAAVLAAKCEEINGYFTCECLIDIDSTSDGAVKYSDVLTVKNNSGISSPHVYALWPCVVAGSYQFWYSAIMGALIAYTDADNDDVPNLSPSNRLVGVTGTVLADGTEVMLDQVQGNVVNSYGVTTAINNNGWRTWGNNTAAYPTTTDPKDRWFCCRRFFSWWGNSFILTYAEKVDNPANLRLIESIVDSENIRGNAYVAQDKCAAAYIEFLEDENTATDIINGKLTFHQHLAPYVPAEDICNTLEFDTDALVSAINGGES
ncbi:MAG: phage tail sheath family protein [Clostridiales bacterium]|nr:phage tail sheath family protein [Clostridiales bacterium]